MKKVKWHILKGKKKHFGKNEVSLVCNSLIDLGLLVGHKGHYTLCLQMRYLSSQVPTLFHTSSFLSLLASHSSSWSWRLARGSVEGA